MGSIPVGDSTRSRDEVEAWAARIEQLHAEIARLQQPLYLPDAVERSAGDPMRLRGDGTRALDERIADLERQRDDLRGRIGALVAERELLRAHIAAVEATRLVRWTRAPRWVYSILRSCLRAT